MPITESGCHRSRVCCASGDGAGVEIELARVYDVVQYEIEQSGGGSP
jgi:hypothetical protein